MKLKAALIVITAFVLSGCATPTSDYLLDKPLVFYSQQTKESELLQQTATTALLDALNRYRWEIRDLDKEASTVVAEACRRGMHCTEIMATIMADGSVSVIRTPGQVLTVEEGTMLKQWMNNLQREYNKNMRHVW